MEDSTIIERLLIFGLSRQEATIYLCLLKNKELTGYEVSKMTGISRSNVYNTLSRLTETGAAFITEGVAVKYTAVSVEEFCSNIIRHLEQEREYLIRNIPENFVISEGYFTIEGHHHVMNKIYNMIKDAERRLYISAPSDFLNRISGWLEAEIDKGIKVVIITEKECSLNAISYQRENSDNQIRLITDSKYVLTGEIIGDSIEACLYSGQKNFVSVFKEALRNEIKLIELMKK